MLNSLWQPFVEYTFMRQALLGGLLLSLSAPTIGTFLMLRRMSLTGDAMSHAILPGVALGYMVAGLSDRVMAIGGFIAGSSVILLSGVVTRLTKNAEDSGLAAFYLISLAIGTLLISINGSQADLLHILFGSILGLDEQTLQLIGIVSLVTLISLVLGYRALVAECVDPDYFSSVSRLGPLVHIGFLLLTVFNLVAGFFALGTLMAVGLMILPGAISRYWCQRLRNILILAILLGFVAVWGGLLFSYYLEWPAGPTIIAILGAGYLVSVCIGRAGGIVWRYKQSTHLSG